MSRHGVLAPYTNTSLNYFTGQVVRGVRLVPVFLSNLYIGRANGTFVLLMTGLTVERKHNRFSLRLIGICLICGSWLLNFTAVVAQAGQTGIFIFREPTIAIFKHIDQSVGSYFHVHRSIKLCFSHEGLHFIETTVGL